MSLTTRNGFQARNFQKQQLKWEASSTRTQLPAPNSKSLQLDPPNSSSEPGGATKPDRWVFSGPPDWPLALAADSRFFKASWRWEIAQSISITASGRPKTPTPKDGSRADTWHAKKSKNLKLGNPCSFLQTRRRKLKFLRRTPETLGIEKLPTRNPQTKHLQVAWV